MESPEIYYSAEEDAEIWSTQDLGDAVDSFVDNNYGDLQQGQIIEVYQGEIHYRPASYFLPNIAEEMESRAYEYAGEVSESWELRHASALSLQAAVSACVDQWYKENHHAPQFGRVENIKPVKARLTVLSDDNVEWEKIEV